VWTLNNHACIYAIATIYVLLASVSEHKPSLKVKMAECSSGLRSTACNRCMSVKNVGQKLDKKRESDSVKKKYFGLGGPSATN
jgi:hypothetical protein